MVSQRFIEFAQFIIPATGELVGRCGICRALFRVPVVRSLVAAQLTDIAYCRVRRIRRLPATSDAGAAGGTARTMV